MGAILLVTRQHERHSTLSAFLSGVYVYIMYTIIYPPLCFELFMMHNAFSLELRALQLDLWQTVPFGGTRHAYEHPNRGIFWKGPKARKLTFGAAADPEN